MSISVPAVLPVQAVVPSLSSTSKHILMRTMTEVPASSQTSFSFTGNNQIEFIINSPSSMWDCLNSFIRFQVTCSLTNNGVESRNKYISEGGAHALFQEIRLETVSGVLLQRIDRYNRLYAMMSNLQHSRDFVEHSLIRAGDSLGYQSSLPLDANPIPYRLTGTRFNISAATQLDGTDTLFTSEVQVGDLIYLNDNVAANRQVVRVTAVVSDIQLTINQSTVFDYTAANLGTATRTRAASYDSQRKRMANTAQYEVCMQPMLPLLLQGNWLPLQLMRGGIRIILTLADPVQCLATTDTATGTGFAANYTIINPFYVCSFVQVDEFLSRQYLDMFRSTGISYQYAGYNYFLNQQAAGGGTFVYQLQPNSRSARTLYTLIQDQRANITSSATVSAGLSSFNCDSISQGLKMGLTQYQIRSGSEVFPYSKPLVTTQADNNEILIVNDEAMARLGSIIFSRRPKPSDLQNFRNEADQFDQGQLGGRAEPRRLGIAVSLTRDTGSGLSGLDLSLAPLICEFNFAGPYNLNTDMSVTGGVQVSSPRFIHNWVEADQVLTLSEAGIIVRS